MQKIHSFTDLKAWQESHVLLLSVYKCTEQFPDREKFGLSNQLRRAAVSVTSNIAEGFGRQSAREKIQFYFHANGSLFEIKSQLYAARDLKYVSEENFKTIMRQADISQSILNGLIKSAPSRQS